jgi:hypothetical protein
MYSWRKFLTVVLLMLSLSARSFASVPLNCEVSQAGGDAALASHHEMMESMHEIAAEPHAQPPHHAHSGNDHHSHGNGHCGTCASCCSGGVLPPIALIAGPSELVRHIAATPPLVEFARFLTGGIERPPRSLAA